MVIGRTTVVQQLQGCPYVTKSASQVMLCLKNMLVDFEMAHRVGYESGHVSAMNPTIEDYVAYMVTDGVRTYSADRTDFINLEASKVTIISGDGKDRETEDLFLAGRDLKDSERYIKHRGTYYSIGGGIRHVPNP